MNNWLKVALYSFVGIIILSLALGVLVPGAGMYPYTSNGNMNMHGGYYDFGRSDNYRNGMGNGMGHMNR